MPAVHHDDADDDESRPRTQPVADERESLSRRRLLAGVGTVVAVGLAGCQGGDGGGGGGDLGDTDGSVGTNEVGSLEVTGLDSDIDPSEVPVGNAKWATEITITNTGDQETQLMEYDYAVSTGSGSALSTGAVNLGGDTVRPGESNSLTLYVPERRGPETIDSYVLSISCGSFAEGVYCEG